MNEFFNYHNVPSVLQKRVRNYVEFQFSVTKGINVEGFNSELPSHLQLELFLHLNRRMVEEGAGDTHGCTSCCAVSRQTSGRGRQTRGDCGQ